MGPTHGTSKVAKNLILDRLWALEKPYCYYSVRGTDNKMTSNDILSTPDQEATCN